MAGRPQRFSRFTTAVGPRTLPRDSKGASRYVRATTANTRESLHQVTKAINDIIVRMKLDSETVLTLALTPILDRSLMLCPEDTGDLRNSARLEVEKSGDKVRGSITYGDSIVWYAPLVHEIMWFHHQPPTQAKFLQLAMEEGVGGLAERIRDLYKELSGITS